MWIQGILKIDDYVITKKMKNKNTLTTDNTALTTPSPSLNAVSNSGLALEKLPSGNAVIANSSPLLRGKRMKAESQQLRNGKWTEEEHRLFLEAIELYGNVWKNVEAHVGTRTCAQIRSHSQKYFQGLRAKALEELRRTNQLKNKVFIVIKEYRNYTGSQTSTGIIENSPVTHAAPLTDEGPKVQKGVSSKVPVELPPLLPDVKEEPRSGMYPSMMEDLAEELKIELIRGVEDVQPEGDSLMGKFTPLEDVVQDMFPCYALGGEVSPGMSEQQFVQYPGYYGSKRKHYEQDGAEAIDYSSLLMKLNYDQQ